MGRLRARSAHGEAADEVGEGEYTERVAMAEEAKCGDCKDGGHAEAMRASARASQRRQRHRN